jgi:hypothetical protein
MTYIVITSILTLIACFTCLFVAENNRQLSSWVDSLLVISGGTFGVICMISISIVLMCGYGWVASDYKAKILNKEFGTEYTREEIFYGSDVIDDIRELQRERIEINGNLITGE